MFFSPDKLGRNIRNSDLWHYDEMWMALITIFDKFHCLTWLPTLRKWLKMNSIIKSLNGMWHLCVQLKEIRHLRKQHIQWATVHSSYILNRRLHLNKVNNHIMNNGIYHIYQTIASLTSALNRFPLHTLHSLSHHEQFPALKLMFNAQIRCSWCRFSILINTYDYIFIYIAIANFVVAVCFSFLHRRCQHWIKWVHCSV